MLPGFRLVLAAIAATLVVVVLGFALLVKLQVAHSGSAGFSPVEARFAGLAFAARADWTPAAPSRPTSLESLAPFAVRWHGSALALPREEATHPAEPVALPYAGSELPLRAPAAEPAALVEIQVAATVRSESSAGMAAALISNVFQVAPRSAHVRTTELAALAIPPAAPPALSKAAKRVTVWHLAAIAPAVPAAEPVQAGAALAIPAAEAGVLAPAMVVSVASSAVKALARGVPLPRARPAPLPLARPANAVVAGRQARPHPAQQRIARQPRPQAAAPARPSAPARQSSNPFEALFGSFGSAGR